MYIWHKQYILCTYDFKGKVIRSTFFVRLIERIYDFVILNVHLMYF